MPSEISCGMPIRKIAPKKAPWIDPSPPITTISTRSIDCTRLNCSGEMNCILWP
ncbi:hypothetical protein D3C72_2379890 [compost metagenome]